MSNQPTLALTDLFVLSILSRGGEVDNHGNPIGPGAPVERLATAVAIYQLSAIVADTEAGATIRAVAGRLTADLATHVVAPHHVGA